MGRTQGPKSFSAAMTKFVANVPKSVICVLCIQNAGSPAILKPGLGEDCKSVFVLLFTFPAKLDFFRAA